MTHPPGRGLQPTRPSTLVLTGILAAVLGYLGFQRLYGDLPDLTWLAGLTLGGLAIVEATAARTTRAKIEKRPQAGRLNPLLVARLAVLAKASSLAGAIFAGAYGGVAVWCLAERGRLAVADANLAPSVAGLVGAGALVAAALILERACRVPEPPEDQSEPGGQNGPPPPASGR